MFGGASELGELGILAEREAPIGILNRKFLLLSVRLA